MPIVDIIAAPSRTLTDFSEHNSNEQLVGQTALLVVCVVSLFI
jgi:hypothetical protein